MRRRTTASRRRERAAALVAMTVVVVAFAIATAARRPEAGDRRSALPAVAGAGAGTAVSKDGVPEVAFPGTVLTETTPGTAQPASEEKNPEAIEPLQIRPLAGVAPGSNDSNPVWSPDGSRIAFERSRGDGKEIVILRPDGTVEDTIRHQAEEAGGASPFLLPGDSGEASFNAGITWSPSGKRFVFMSNGGEGNYDLFLRDPGGEPSRRLTDHKEKDGHAHWSPAADNLVVFVSGRTGKGDLYLLDVSTRALARLTPGEKAYLYPRWSPDGTKIAATRGNNENHDIHLFDGVAGPGGRTTERTLTSWPWDDIRPAWSPDGTKIAFYSNYSPAGDPMGWSILVVASDGTDPREGEGLAAKVAAADIIPDVETGPAWMPDSQGIVYVKNDRHEYNPIYIVDFKSGTERPVRTGTKMNHDVACSPDGLLAFRAQVDQWDHMFLARLRKKAPYR
jgi:Tol biopolymer transport system component